MKQFYCRAMMLVMIITCIAKGMQAQNFHVVDVNKSKDANPVNNTRSDGYDWGYQDKFYAILNAVAYFSADDGIHGTELWRSDGTSAGTYMIKDINIGVASSNISDITISGGKVFFSATDGVNAQEIWVTDGTEQGTKIVADLSVSGSYNPSYLTDVNGVLYFFTDSYNTYTTASQLWKTDGTANGTVMIADFYNSPSFSFASQGRQITNVNGHVFFTILINGWASELCYSDGTTAGTILLNNINPNGYGSNSSYLTPLNSSLYFSADDGTGLQLWTSDGTMAGTHKINNANSIYLDNDIYVHFQSLKNTLYFTGYSPDGDGTELCKYDASKPSNNVVVVKDINPGDGANNNNLYNITNVNGTLFFSVYNGHDQTLWKSDGTSRGTVEVKDINPGGHNIYLFKNFINANGTLLFSFYDDENGYELWKSDGTTKGTVMVREINPGIYSSWVSNICYFEKNVSLFEAYDGKNGFELWRTDGSAQGTSMIKNINQTSTASSNPVWLTLAPDHESLIFAAYDPEYGHEMRITDGSDAGTRVIKDIYKGSFDSWPYLPANFKNNTYFFANIDNPVPRHDHGSDVFLVSRFWKTDGTEKGTSMLSVPGLEALINDSGYVENPPSAPIATDNLLYLVVFNNATYLQELWRSDGTSAGTYAIKTDISPYYSITPTPVGNTLFFINYDNVNGIELWSSDGTSAGTKSIPGVIYPEDLFSFKDKLYFTAYDASYNNFLWVSDGSANGTKTLKNVYVYPYVPFAQANGKLFFTGSDPNTTTGYELWSTDGTVYGTRLVKDIYTGSYNSSFPQNLTGTGSLLFFTAYDSAHGYELWKSDGSSLGTRLVKDITPGVDGSYGISNLVNANGQLYFLNNGVLWTSDGTTYGTNSVSDASIANVCCISNMTAFGNKLAFLGYSYAYGSEMWVGNSACGNAQDNSVINKFTPAEDESGTTSIYPNPVNNTLNVKIVSSADSKILLTILDVTGNPVMNTSAAAGQTFMQINVANLSAGTYFLKILSTNSSENVVKKFVKL